MGGGNVGRANALIMLPGAPGRLVTHPPKSKTACDVNGKRNKKQTANKVDFFLKSRSIQYNDTTGEKYKAQYKKSQTLELCRTCASDVIPVETGIQSMQ